MKKIMPLLTLSCLLVGSSLSSQNQIVTRIGSASNKLSSLSFQTPTWDHPKYEVRASLEITGRPFIFEALTLGSISPRPFFIMKGGKPADLTKPLEPGLYEVVIPWAWKSGREFGIQIDFQGEKTLRSGVTAAPEGGAPEGCAEGFATVFKIEEEAGIARKQEIVYLTLTAPKAEAEAADFAVFDGDKRLASQVIETKESIPPESQAKTHPVTMTKKLAVAVDATPRERKIIRVFKAAGQAGQAVPNAFELAGDGLGKTVKGTNYSLQFHPQSGQINTIEDFAVGVKLYNKAGVIHWNPDVFTPGIAWDHSYDWKPPRAFEEKNGPLVYLNARHGPMPRIKDVFLEVKYTLEKGVPYFLAETRMRVDKDLAVVALRNDEMVLYKELFDTLVYRDKDGRLIQNPLKEIPGAPYGLTHVAAADLDWVGLLNAKSGYGFFSLRLESSVTNLGLGGDFSHRAGTYFYAPSDGEYVYWVRPWLYTWAEYSTSNLLTALPAGSVFYEKNAYLVSRWNGETPASLDGLARRLKNPLRVF
jgi:hypothetical protein